MQAKITEYTNISQKTEEGDSMQEAEIGLIPQGWEVVRLGDVAHIIRGTSWRKDEANKDGIGLPIIAIPNIGDGSINFDFQHFLTKKVQDKKLLKVGDIIFVGSSGSLHNIGRNALVKYLPLNKISFASFLALVRVKKGGIISDFLYYIINSIWVDFAKFVKRASDGKYNFQLREFQNNALIPLPPLPEQQKIAQVLGTIQKAIEQQDKIIEAAKNLKKSLMQKLFTEGLGHTEFKETGIGEIPPDWEAMKLGEDDVLTLTQYGLSLRGSEEGEYPILRMNNLVNGYVDINDLQFVDLDDEVFQKFKLEKGDILFNRTNSIELVGKTSIFTLERRFVFASYLIRLKTNPEKTDPYFLNFYLNWDITQTRLKSLASRGVSQANISATRLKTLKIPLPPLPEQQEIARLLKTVDKKIDVEERKKVTLEELFRTMLHKLMTGEIRLEDIEV